ncbi:polyprenyl synthetase family protein [Microbacterium cremeum]|uniref:polyprenyl synthetase family protein n=1 Tax=Microbacterium cremeum TaxID=2782169 RepID=UPI001889062E|nr:polyprenyl synthetase family protein [Microbacterium cremeum]
MNVTAPDPALDIAIDGSLARIRDRAVDLGPGFAALGAAISRAARGGKRLRPALVLASFRAFGGGEPHASAVLSVGAAFELLHAAFLVHDDVIDHDTVRRGVPNVSGEFRSRGLDQGADPDGAALLGDAAAILAGDLLLHEAFRLIAMADVAAGTREHLLALLDDAIFVSAAGELSDVEQSVSARAATREDALATAYRKTAVYSFSAPLQAGALLGGATADSQRVLAHAGGWLGLAFQLVDDLIGTFGSSDQAGREAGVDLREGKRTPLVAIARETMGGTRVDDVLVRARTGPVAVRVAQRELESSGARRRLIALIDETLGDVRSASRDAQLPGPAGALLRELADQVERRIP